MTVDRPLRLRVVPDADLSAGKLKEAEIALCREAIANVAPEVPLTNWTLYASALHLKAALLKKLRPLITVADPAANIVRDSKQPHLCETDPALRDTEQIPLLYPGGIAAFMENELLPYAPDAFVDEDKTVIGYELSFTKYFYRPVELRSRETIAAEIRELEATTDGLLNAILND